MRKVISFLLPLILMMGFATEFSANSRDSALEMAQRLGDNKQCSDFAKYYDIYNNMSVEEHNKKNYQERNRFSNRALEYLAKAKKCERCKWSDVKSTVLEIYQSNMKLPSVECK